MDNATQFVMQVLSGKVPLRIRTLLTGETLPATIEAGFEQLGQLDPSWVWVAERDSQVLGAIVASPAHGVALIWRLWIAPGQPANLLPRLLKVFMQDMRSRGVRGYMTMIDPDVPAQARLQKIIERGHGASPVSARFRLLAAPVWQGGLT